MSHLFNTIARALEDELAPLNSMHFGNAEIRVQVVIVNGKYELLVYGPEHCRIFIPKIYYAMPVQFMDWAKLPLQLSTSIDVSQVTHGIYG